MLTKTLTSAVLSIVFIASSGSIHGYAADYGSKSSFGNERIFYHNNNKSEDGNYFNDLRGYPNASPIFKLKDAVAHKGDGSLSFNTHETNNSPNSITCNGNINFSVPSTTCEIAIIIDPPTSDCTITSMSYTISGGPSAPTGTSASDPSGTYEVGSYMINWSITDCDGPTTCMQTVDILDMTAPVLTCPMSLNIDCTTDPVPAAFANFTEFTAAGGLVTDNCMIDQSSFALLSETTTGTPCNQTIVREYQIFDVNNQGGICTRSIFIQDNIQPDFTDPADITISCDQDPTDLTLTGDVTDESDNCDDPAPQATFTDTNNIDNCGNTTGTITRSWSLTDACDNVRNRTQIITIEDNTAPAVDCSALNNLILECDGDYTTEINNWLAANEAATLAGATDNCSNITVANNYIAGTLPAMSCMATAGITVTFTATDDCGNVGSCTAQLILDDNTAPTVDCSVASNLTLECDGDYTSEINTWLNATETAILNSPGTVDQCGGTLSISNNYAGTIPATSCDASTGTAVTFTVTDGCMNSASCTVSIIITDTFDPTFTVPSNLTISCEQDPSDLTLTGDVTDEADDCDTGLQATFSDATAAGTCADESTITRTWTLVDACGNDNVQVQTITIVDNTDPTFTVPNSLTISCEQDPTDLTLTGDVTDEADNCAAGLQATFSDATAAGTCADESTITRTWTLVDACGNDNVQVQTITIVDNTDPTFTVPSSITISCEQDPTDLTLTGDVTNESDNCSVGIQATFSDASVAGTCADESTITRTWTLVDACGNDNVQVQTITVTDNVDPVAVCQNVSLTLDATGSATLLASQVDNGSSDNCDSALEFSLSRSTFFCNDVISSPIAVTMTVTDNCGNTDECIVNVSIIDDVTPVLTCPAALTAVCNITEQPAYADFNAFLAAGGTFSDMCDANPATFMVSEVSDNDSCPETLTRTYSISDFGGNNISCQQTIVVDDNILPTIDCPDNITQNSDAGVCNANVTVPAPTTSDNCGVQSVTNDFNNTADASGIYPVGTTTVIFTVTDLCGNTNTCSMSVTVNDTELPTINCPAELTAVCTDTEQSVYADFAAFQAAGGSASDNCGVNMASFTFVGQISDGNTCPEMITRTYQIADVFGNTNTCTQVVMVDDNINPSFTVPANITISCDQNASDLTITGDVIDEADNCVVNEATFTDATAAGACANESTISRTWTLVDACGNDNVQIQTITIEDNTPPVLNCGADFTVNVDAGVCTAMVTIAVPNPTDNCGVVSLVNDYNGQGDASDMYPIGTTMITWTATDACNNASTCSINLTVEDNLDPTISCPPNLTAVCGIAEQPMYADLAAFMAAGGMVDDNCGIDATSFTMLSETSDGATCPEVVTRVYQIADASGNTATCSQTITIDDEEAPTFTCGANLTVNVDAGLCTSMVTIAVPSPTDNCGVTDLTNDFNNQGDASGMYPLGNTTVTWTATDGCGNTTTCEIMVTVLDNIDPMITCPADLTAVCGITEQPAYADLAALTSAGGSVSDNCDIDATSFMMLSETSDGAMCPEVVTRVYQISDDSGNTASCSQMITIDDEVMPTITCPTNITVSADAGVCTAAVTIAVPTTGDNCGVSSVVNDFNNTNDASGTYAVGTNTVVYTVTDACNNTSTCSFTVTVNDTEAPMITCPANLTAVCGIAEQAAYADLAAFTAAGGSTSDNCGIDAASFTMLSETSDGATCPEVVTRVYQITDVAGLSSTCSQTITINDEVDPVLMNCPGDITVNADTNLCQATVTLAVPTATDNCNSVTITNNITTTADASGVFLQGTTQVVWTATDGCGNTATCMASVTVEDNMPPIVGCPNDLSAQCSTAEQTPYATFAEFTAAGGLVLDNCGVDASSFTYLGEVSDGMSCPETFTRTYQIADIFGNTTTCIQMVVVNDDINPTITCPGDITVNADPGVCNAAITLTVPTTNDNCSVVSVLNDFNGTENASGTYGVGTTTVVYTVTDGCNNTATCDFTVTVLDVEDPVLTCPADITTDCDIADEPAYATLTDFTAAGGTASDNCGFTSSTFTLLSSVSDGNTCPEIFTRTYQITDLSGNTGTCTQLITVDDETAPVLTCGGDITVNAEAGMCSAMVTVAVPSPTDNCAITSFTNDFNGAADASGTYPVGTTTVTWTATDACMNMTTCSISVTISDNEAPMITCPPAITAQCGPNEQGAYSSLTEFTAAGGSVSDNCGIDNSSFTLLSSTSDNASCPETITRVYQISDVNGNTASCSQQLVVDDTVVPTLVCAGDFTVNTDSGLCTAMVTLAIPSTDDNCGVLSLTNNVTGVADASGIYNLGTTMIVWTVTDLCGNTNTCEVNVTIQDNEDPMIACPPMIMGQCAASDAAPYADITEFTTAGGTVSDNCDMDLTLSLLSETSDGLTCPETLTRVYQVMDDSGNTASCRQVLVVDDTTDPTITCPLDITVNAATGTCEAMVSISIPVASDNCGISSIVNDFNNTDDASGTYPVGITTVTYTITDDCDNTSICSFNVTVEDVDPPTFDCSLFEMAFPFEFNCNDGDPVDIIEKLIGDIQNADILSTFYSDLCDDDLTLENDYDGVSVPDVSCDGSEGLIVTFTVTDDSGNSASCTAQFTLIDETAPTFDTQPTPIGDITCEDPFPVQEILTATDDCGPASVTPTIDAFVVDQCNGYIVTYRWTATDECGNSSQTTQSFRVLPDTTAPTFDITPNPIANIECDDDLPIAQVLTASDSCQDDPATVSFAVVPFVVDQCNGYTITYQWTATDNCGNTATTTAEFNVLPDTTAPVFDADPAPISDINCDDPLPTPEVLTATDACQTDQVMIVQDILPFVVDQCSGYEITYRWTATDNCGNSSVATESFNVLPDVEGPVFDSQPQALPDINCDDPFPAFEMLSATDACQTDAVTVETSFSQTSADFCSGYTVTYTWTATDNCDNTTTVETSFEVLPDMEAPIFDMEAPMISDINCDDELPLFPVVTATDNCDASPDVTTDIVPFVVDQCNGYPVTYVWTATDVCGNSATISTTFMVLADTTPPVFDSQPTALSDISCDTALPTQEVLTATDACGDAMVVATIDPFVVDICAGYTVTHRWVATDACGNSATVTESFEVLPDTTPPVFDSMPTALPDISCDTALPAQEVLTATDDCSSLNVVATIDPFVEDTCNGYMVTHRWVATDACMNSTTVTESFMVLPDTEAPTFDSTPVPLADIPCSASFPDQEDITATDNCNGATVVETVDPFVADICNGYTVIYRWTATDACGNNTETTQSFNVLPDTADPTFDSAPMSIADINCDDPFPTQEVLTASDDCGMVTIVTSTDPFTVDVCGGYTVTYRWVATDACSNSTEVTQSFNVLPDTESPVLTCSDITVGTDDGVCEALVTVLAPPFTDDCSTVSFTNDRTGNADASGVYPEGTTTITWTATDDCGNTSSCMQSITVIDDESPVITCLGTACLFLDANGEVSLNPDDYVLTYSDNCSDRNDIMITGRRLEMNGGPCSDPDNDVFGSSVSFCCADAGTTVMVELQANDETGNVTACMIQVEIKDIRAPMLVAPSVCLPDITVSCEFDFDYDDLSVFGNIVFDAADVEDIVINDPFYAGTGNIAGEDALFSDNCPDGLSVSESTVGVDDLVCNQGTVTRTLVVTDASGNTTSCVQMITVEDIDPFDEDDIEWPADFEFTNCVDFNPDPSVTGQPVLTIDKCSQPGFNSSDQVFNYPIEGCQLIRRTWTVIDWCQYVANSGSTTGLFTHVQDIVLTNSVAPEFTFDCEDTTICANELTCQGELNITATATDDCTPTADLVWSYTLDLFDAGTTLISNTGNTITGTYPRGTHRLTWNVEDRCGNLSTCNYLLTIRDCKAPTVVCKFGLSTSLMPMNGTGMIEIWANDFVQSASDNCTLVDDLEYSFSSDITDKSLMFTCLDLGEQEVEVWATDEDGNQSRCITFIDIQDNNNACDNNADQRAMISGRVSTQDYDGILDAEISIESTDMIESMMSIDEGDFAFADVPMYLDYEVKAYKNDDPMNGVSTLDLLIIQKHILGINPLQTPYDRIAADINNSESISAVDLIELRKLILGVYSELPNNDSWRFVDASFEFEDEETPWPFQEEITYSNLLSDEMDSDFVGVKIGDVNGSVTASLQLGSLDSRSIYQGIELYVDDVDYTTGQEFTVPIRVSKASDIQGLQMQLVYDHSSLELVAVADGIIEIKPSEYYRSEGKVGLSWTSIEEQSIDASEKLMSLVFKAKSNGNLESLHIATDQIKPEVYNTALETGPVELELRIMDNGGFELAQNKPNPFKNMTEIQFHLPEAGPTTLIVYDAQGKLVLSQRNYHEAGWNTIELTKADLQVGSGVLFYKLKAGSFTETKQMLLID